MKRHNRRNHIRSRSLLPIHYSEPETGHWVKTRVSDQNDNGICILSETNYSPEHKLEIRLFGKPDKIPSTVIWCKSTGYKTGSNSMFRVGLKYVE